MELTAQWVPLAQRVSQVPRALRALLERQVQELRVPLEKLAQPVQQAPPVQELRVPLAE